MALQLDTGAAYASLALANAVSYLLAAALLLTLPRGRGAARRPPTRLFTVLRDRPFLVVTVLNGLLMTYGAVLTVALPLWIVQRTQAPRWAVAATFLVNTALAVALQVRASRGAQTVAGAARVSRRAGVVLLLACLVFAVSGGVDAGWALAALAAGAVLLTLGELLQSAGSWGLSYGLAPEEHQGQYLGAWAMGTRIYDAVGPALVVGLVLGLGAVGWLVLGGFFLVVAASLVPVSGWAQRRASQGSPVDQASVGSTSSR